MRVMRPAMLIVGPSLTGSSSARQSFDAACKTVPVIELGADFSTLDAGDAASRLMEKIRLLATSQLQS